MMWFKPKGRPQKQFFPRAFLISALVAAVIVLLGWVLHVRLEMDNHTRLIREQEWAVAEQKYALRRELTSATGTATALAQIAASHLMARQGAAKPDESGGSVGSVGAAFLKFARNRQVFDQLRLMDPEGREIVTITRMHSSSGASYFKNTTSGQPRDVSTTKWWGDLLALAPGTAAVIGLNLKTDDNGRYEQPNQPVLRVGAALPSGAQSDPLGFVLVDYAAKSFFQPIQRMDEHLKTSTLIANANGYWLRNPDPSLEWGFLFSERKNRTLAVSHPRIWADVSRNATGTFAGPDGIVVFNTLNPQTKNLPGGPAAASAQWKVLTWVPPDVVAARENAATAPIWRWAALALALFLPATYLMVRDREQKRLALRSKEQARSLLQSIADTSSDGIIAGEAVRDALGDIADFRKIFANPVAEFMLKIFNRGGGHGGGQAEQKKTQENSFPLFFSPDFFAQCVQVVVTGNRFEIEQKAECTDLGERWFRFMVVKLGDGVVLSFSDITRQKFSVNELRQAKETAEVANRAKTQFLTMMGHEIRTPMNGLLGFASLLEKTVLSEEQRDYTSTLRLSGEALLRILDDILDYSHMEHDALHVTYAPVDLKELVSQVGRLFTMALDDRRLKLVTKIAPNVPSRILGDDVRLRQILVNLVGNALKFTEEGSLLIHVERDTGVDGDFIVFHVVDSGQGISPEMIDRLFKPFSQVDSAINRRFGGTGLGLSICKRLVETMGGEIGVHTAPGKGSDFFFTLPVKLPEFSAAPVLPADKPLPAAGPPIRILVVDDDSINRKLVLRMIERIGARAELAESGAQAVKAFQNATFDLILMDIQMPGMDGMETTLRIRALEKASGTTQRTHISALTANSGARCRTQCFEAGMDDFLGKPIRMQDLEALIWTQRKAGRPVCG